MKKERKQYVKPTTECVDLKLKGNLLAGSETKSTSSIEAASLDGFSDDMQ